jgi:DNA-binding transcriptional regulator GbsR (MarR family)
MPETQYRASRVCRVLGNPTAYQIIKALSSSKKKPREIAAELGLSLTLVSQTLRVMRNVDIVRYKTEGKEKIYWIKDNSMYRICKSLERFVIRMRHKGW